MSKIMVDEKEYEELCYAWYKLDTLEAGGIDNTMAYEESFAQDLEYWNDEHPEESYEYWEDMVEVAVKKMVSEADKGVYILWEDSIIQGVYSTYDKAYKAMCAAIDKIDSVKVDWADEDCGFTTVYDTFGDIIEFEISDEYAVQ